MFNEMYDFIANGTPMGPGASWMLIFLLFGGTALFVLGIREIDTFAQLAAYNTKSSGARGIWYALRGIETYSIQRERVISVAPNQVGYLARTFDGEEMKDYYVVPSKEDSENPDYEIAIDLAGNDDELRERLLPDSRVKKCFSVEGSESSADFIIVYLRRNNLQEVEDTLNKFFKEQYQKAISNSRAERLGNKAIS